jgi:hypothetical protein
VVQGVASISSSERHQPHEIKNPKEGHFGTIYNASNISAIYLNNFPLFLPLPPTGMVHVPKRGVGRYAWGRLPLTRTFTLQRHPQVKISSKKMNFMIPVCKHSSLFTLKEYLTLFLQLPPNIQHTIVLLTWNYQRHLVINS